MVSLYEIHGACVYSHTSWPDWLKLTSYARAEIIAHYRIEKLIELHYALKHKSELQRMNLLG